ncbi:MAG: DUF1501 domain-containing protein [Gemmataceae bacterium]
MNHHSPLARRWFLQQCGVGLGAVALSQLLSEDGYARAGDDPISPKAPHFAPKAKRVIFLFQAGAPSHLDLFDPKPKLTEMDGKLPPASLLEGYRAAFINPNSKCLGPKFKFAKYGQCGADFSELLPYTAKIADDLTIVKSMTTDAFNHAPGQLLMNTGTMQFGRPSFGAWTLYGLGQESKDLPGFVVFSTGSKGPSGGNSCWGSGFLPSLYQGVTFRVGSEPVLYLNNPKGVDPATQKAALDSIGKLNKLRFDEAGDPEILTRINSYEMAGRMQAAAPDVTDLTKESKETLELYGAEPGKTSYANACLLARRLVERGVRFVQIYHEAWDQHGNLKADLRKNCKNTDKASAALVSDLKRRGLLKDTLVIWGGEFGRTPMVQGGGDDGRDHHPNAFTYWMAGGGLKPGLTLGKSDDLGFNAMEDRVHVHDLHATLLHLMGFDHTKLNFKFQGRPFRLTDVHGNVVNKLIA